MAWNHEKGLCWYNDEFCFIGVPKNASTSFRQTFKVGGNIDNYLKPKNPNILNLKLVTVIREPLDRVISGYLESINRREKNTINKNFFKMVESKERFIEFLKELENGFFDCHIEKQHFYVTNNDGVLLPFDIIIDFDNFNQEINDLNKKAIKTNISSKNQKQFVKSYIDEDVLNKIKKIYKEDFELYKHIKNGNK